MRAGFLFAMLTLGLGSSALAATYRWVDKNGQVHYTQAPPPAGQSQGEAQSIQPAAASPPSVGTQQAPSRPGSAGPTSMTVIPASRDTQCSQAKWDLQVASAQNGVYARDADGKFNRESDQQVQQEKSDAERRIKEFCN